jgi:hypothetical protein
MFHPTGTMVNAEDEEVNGIQEDVARKKITTGTVGVIIIFYSVLELY